MYRFLDKRFYHKSRWEFDLTEFACEHIGVSRNYDTGQLKRRLQPAIGELEAVGFLEALPAGQRFVKISRGEWRIVFVQKAVPQIEPPSHDAVLLIKKLAERGVTPSVAAKLVRNHPKELIEMQMEVLNRLEHAKERESIRNPAGYLVKSIREGYVPPAKMIGKKAQAKREVETRAAVAKAVDLGHQKIEAYLRSLSKQESDALEIEAIARADKHLVEGYQRSKTVGGATFAVYRRMVLEREAKRLLAAKDESTKDAA